MSTSSNQSRWQSVYALLARDGLVKVGVSTHLTSRKKALSTNEGIEIVDEFVTPPCIGAREMERKMHTILADAWAFGEWFYAPYNEIVMELYCFYMYQLKGKGLNGGRFEAWMLPDCVSSMTESECLLRGKELEKLSKRDGVDVLKRPLKGERHVAKNLPARIRAKVDRRAAKKQAIDDRRWKEYRLLHPNPRDVEYDSEYNELVSLGKTMMDAMAHAEEVC